VAISTRAAAGSRLTTQMDSVSSALRPAKALAATASLSIGASGLMSTSSYRRRMKFSAVPLTSSCVGERRLTSLSSRQSSFVPNRRRSWASCYSLISGIRTIASVARSRCHAKQAPSTLQSISGPRSTGRDFPSDLNRLAG